MKGLGFVWSAIVVASVTTAFVRGQEAGKGPEPQLVVGRVLDDAGVPLAGAGILVGAVESLTTQAALRQPTVATGADGGFRLSLEEGELDVPPALLVAAPGRASVLWRHLGSARRFTKFGRDAPLDLGDVRLSRGVAIEGRVRDERGRPLAGARVLCEDLLTARLFQGERRAALAISDERGAFVLEGACPTAVRVVVEAPGYYRCTVPVMNAGEPLVAVLAESGFVAGRLVGAAGDPVIEPAQVFVHYELQDEFEQRVQCEAGRFRFSVRHPCRFAIGAFTRKSGAVAESGILPGPVDGLELVFDAPGEDSGVVVTAKDRASGEAVATFSAMMAWDEHFDPTWARARMNWGARPAKDGTAKLPNPTSGQSRVGHLLVAAPGHAPYHRQGIRAESGKVVRVVAELEPALTIRGQTVDAKSGEPVAGATVVAVQKSEWEPAGWRHVVAEATTDAKGCFALTDLGKSKLMIVAQRAGTRVEDSRAVDEHVDEVSLTLAPPVAVHGKVEHPALPGGARVVFDLQEDAAFPVADEDLWSLAIDPSTVPGAVPLASDGSFRVPGLAPGRYQMTLLLPAPPRTGPPLRVPLRTLRLGNRGGQQRIDVKAPALAHVAGKVAISGAIAPYGRFAVVAEPTERGPVGAPSFRQHVERRRWVLPDREGGFSMPLIAGDHHLSLVDVVTGVTLFNTEESITLAAGETLGDVALEATVVEVRLTLVPASGRRLIVDHVAITAAFDAGRGLTNDKVLGPAGITDGAAISLISGLREHRFYVPPGSVKLEAAAGATELGGSWSRFDGTVLGTTEFEAESARPGAKWVPPTQVTLEVGPPPDLGK